MQSAFSFFEINGIALTDNRLQLFFQLCGHPVRPAQAANNFRFIGEEHFADG